MVNNRATVARSALKTGWTLPLLSFKPRSSQRHSLVLRTGAPWRDLPDGYLAYQTCHRRFRGWVNDGSVENVLHALAEDLHERGGLDLCECFINGTFIPANKGMATAWKGQAGQRYEGYGSGRAHRSSRRHTRRARFAARGQSCRSHIGSSACVGTFAQTDWSPSL